MKNAFLLVSITLGFIASLHSQILLDSTLNSSTKKILMAAPNSFAFGSYGEAHYNQEVVEGTFQNGNMDVHRVILFMGYKFNKNFQFFSEIEFEHAQEVFVEQAFLNYRFNSAFNLKAGMILIPMGIVNEFHEPTLFNGVERPDVDKYILPTTWREMGIGAHGIIKRANIQYQAYIVNGFMGYNGGANISGSNGLRNARQKGAEAVFRTPSFATKLTYYGLNGLNLGVSGYFGTSESNLYDGLDRNDNVAVATADSSLIGISMIGVNATYRIKNISLRAVGNITNLSNTEEYNEFTGSNAGSQIMGYYGEVAYHINMKKNDVYPQLVPFVRYENFNTQFAVNRNMTANDSYHREILTAGAGFQITPGTVVKADYQWRKTIANPKPTGMLNIGFGYWF